MRVESQTENLRYHHLRLAWVERFGVTGDPLLPGRKLNEQPSESKLPELEGQVNLAVEQLNKLTDAFRLSLKFAVHKETGAIVVRLIENETGDVIREIPPEKALDAVARMWQQMGLLLDEKA